MKIKKIEVGYFKGLNTMHFLIYYQLMDYHDYQLLV